MCNIQIVPGVQIVADSSKDNKYNGKELQDDMGLE